jgi:hypothetical protein
MLRVVELLRLSINSVIAGFISEEEPRLQSLRKDATLTRLLVGGNAVAAAHSEG